jgi:hypothetical protein
MLVRPVRKNTETGHHLQQGLRIVRGAAVGRGLPPVISRPAPALVLPPMVFVPVIQSDSSPIHSKHDYICLRLIPHRLTPSGGEHEHALVVIDSSLFFAFGRLDPIDLFVRVSSMILVVIDSSLHQIRIRVLCLNWFGRFGRG